MKQLQIKHLTVGELQSNCYLLYENDSGKTLIIDPGDAADYITTIINDLKLIPVMIIATHGHFDHILAASYLQINFSIPFAVNRKDNFLLENLKKSAAYFLKREIRENSPIINKFIENEDLIKIGNQGIRVLETPGHTPGSICLYSERQKILFTGDTIFFDGEGRTDFSYGSDKQMKSSLDKIFRLSADTKALPGHGQPFLLGEYQKFAESHNNL